MVFNLKEHIRSQANQMAEMQKNLDKLLIDSKFSK